MPISSLARRWLFAASAAVIAPSVATATSAADSLSVPVAASRIATAGPSAARAPAARASSADDGFEVSSRWSFRVEPANGVVRVAMEMNVVNQVPTSYGPFAISRTYLAGVPVPVLAEATGFAATDLVTGAPLAVTTEATEVPQLALAVIDLEADLFFGESVGIRLTFDLPGQAPRSTGLTRVNPAFASLVPIIDGDAGMVDVEIVVPEGFEIEIVGNALERSERPGEVVFSAVGADPLEFDNAVVLRDDDGLVADVVDAGGHEVEVRAWPGDAEWGQYVSRLASESVPVLTELTGRPWPAGDRLRITETVAPYLYGYAGWYTSDDDGIEVGDELNAEVVVHEISHVWFNDEWFAERWIGEAFAQEYTSRVLPEIGEEPVAPGPVSVDDPGRLRLADWSDPALFDQLSDAQEEYGYNASWAVLRTVTDEVGIGGLAEVLAAIDDGTIAYRGEADPERWRARTDWRRLLDLLQEVGGSGIAEVVFAEHVVPEPELARLAERSTARAAYAELSAAAPGWSAPLAVREDLAGWEFVLAADSVAAAYEVLATRDALAALVTPLGLELTGLESGYEAADDAAELRALPGAFREIGEEIVAVGRAADTSTGLWRGIGLFGTGVGDEIGAAGRAFERGELDAASDAVARAERMLSDAGLEGQRRLAALVGAVLVLVTGRRSWSVLRARRMP